ncbi:hypothetical protein [Sphaerisporangium sp. TRM90804]|uniref:hypothetical protein n=1 Tax=Sphaerisporangium sp. TRM90804 TaxID=3031113 RepID=UPI002449970E|nr:hypothetical protein [Sphaerisporangium sp. TRM90804]MDH2425738.1 hypothetical protein [Sphaerisporangium sp. TRM90804]
MTDDSALPAEAFPLAIYSADRHATPDTVHAQESEQALMLWISGLMLSTPRSADDTRLHAAIDMSRAIARAAERHGAQLRAELERRDRERQADKAEAAVRAAEAARRHADTSPPGPGDTVLIPAAGRADQTLAMPVANGEQEVTGAGR